MVYDEGFQIEHGHYVFFAFSKYKPEGMKVYSYCGETLIGWYSNKKTHERGCYRAIKKEDKGDKS
jgi:cathepsin C